MNALRALRDGSRIAWDRLPALQLLLPLALGVYLYPIFHGRSILLVVGGGMSLLAVSLVLMRLASAGAQCYSWGRILFGIGASVVIGGLMMCRMELLPELNYKLDVSTQRNALISSMKEQSTISAEVQRLLQAIVLGYTEKDAATRSMRQDFALSGAAHILAVSGYHLGVIMAFASLGLSALRRTVSGHAVHYALLIVLAWGFTALTGWGTPTVRAALMLTLYLIGRMLRRPTFLPNILAMSAALQLMAQPNLLYSYGMWLSYVAVLSIYLFGGAFYGSIGLVRVALLGWVWRVLTISIAVQVLVLPLCLYLFGYVSWSFIATALPMAILSALIIPLGFIAYVCTHLGCGVEWLLSAVEYLGQAILWVVDYGRRLTPLHQSGTLSLWGLAALWLLALLPGVYSLGQRMQRLNHYCTKR